MIEVAPEQIGITRPAAMAPGATLGVTSLRYGRVAKYNSNHDSAGRFSSGSGSLALRPSAMASRLHEPDGGFTINPQTGKEPTTGFVVSVHPSRGVTMGDVTKISGSKILSTVVSFREKNADILAQPNNNIGAWHDPATGIGHMDISAVVPTASEAHALGLQHGQIAYYDLEKGQSVLVRGAA